MKIEIGATGKLVTGDVLDVNKASLERKLKEYDPQLYLKWNPTKNRGMGIWELRRCPEKKSAHYLGTFDGMNIFSIQYKETEIVNHVKDLPYLNYSVIEWLQKSDTWAYKNYALELERQEQEHRDNYYNKAREERIYMMKQEKSVIRDLRERINSGVNPNLLGAFWGRK